MAADAVYLPAQVEVNAVVRLKTATEVNTGDDGAESRVARWPTPLREWTVAYGPDYVEDVENLFFTQRGPRYSFLFRPPRARDYTITDQAIGIGDGSETEFQLVQTITVGSRTLSRTILHPRADTLVIKLNGTPNVDFTLGDSGLVTMDVAPDASVSITADFEYDTAVRFASDTLETSMPTSFKAAGDDTATIIETLRSVTIQEVPNE